MNPNADFDSKFSFYYDETNNIKKLKVNEDGYNNSFDSNFVLGGIAFEGAEPNIEDLFHGLNLQKSLIDVKFKHIAKGSFVDCLKSEKLKFFLEYLAKSNLYIHYSTINTLYYSVVDIVDSAIANSSVAEELGPGFVFELKNTLYQLFQLDKEAVQELFFRYQYPNIKAECVISFIEDLTTVFDPYIDEFEYHVPLTSLKQILKEVKKEGALPFIMDNEDYVLLQDFYHFYLRPIYTFKNSTHIFDKEDDIEQTLKKYEIKYGDEIINSYKFIDSSTNRFIQTSDFVVGIIGKLFEFLNTSSMEEIRNIRANITNNQVVSLDNLLDLIDKAEGRNRGFLHNIMGIIDFEKFECLYEKKTRKNETKHRKKPSDKKKRKKPRIRTNAQIVARWQRKKRSKRTRIIRKQKKRT
jgi:hypothetical protein